MPLLHTNLASFIICVQTLSAFTQGIHVQVITDKSGKHQFLARPSNDTLHCFACTFETDGEKCKDFYNKTMKTEACPNDHKCQIWHFYSLGSKYAENLIETFYFERKCIKDCNEGIVPLDDMGNRFVSHTSCCTESYCNVGNNAERSIALNKTSGFLIIMFIVTYTNCYK